MKTPSLDITSHVIIFHDKSRKFIPRRVYDFIWEQSMRGVKQLKVGDELITLSSIAKLISYDNFVAEYPSDVPAGIPVFPYERLLPKEKCSRVSALESLIKGITKYIESDKNQKTGNPENLREKMYERLSLAKADLD
jgi:hypothetical protein